jgi:hypothetical protein
MPSDLASYDFVVILCAPVELTVEERSVTASYFQEERSFTLFKDASHAVVAAFKTDFVVQVLRGPVDFAV